MIFKQQQFQQEKVRIDQLNEKLRDDARVDDFTKKYGLSYSDMNSRMLQMEEKDVKDAREWKRRKTEHERRKKEIEDHWHDSTGQAMRGLQDKIPKDKEGKKYSRRNKEHYSGFSLQELEIVMKNNKYGSNSQVYNDVATDLELFNSLVKNGGEESERYEVLNRLLESCKEYIDSRSPITRPGRRRKAMIEKLYDKVQLEISKFAEDTQMAYADIEKAEDLSQVSQEVVEKAVSGKFNLLSHYLQEEVKNIPVEKLERMKILQTEEDSKNDKELLKLAKVLEVQEIEENQSDFLSTRFFNAIGWAKRTPEQITDTKEAEKKAPVKVRLYHTIGIAEKGIRSEKDPVTAQGMVDQLAGTTEDSRQYLGSGNFGKGTYTAARGIAFENADDEKKFEIDKAASEHSWSFGTSLGSMQVTMTFNQNAKIIDMNHAKVLCDHFQTKYPDFCSYLKEAEAHGGYKASALPLEVSIILAFYGYNTIRVPSLATGDVDSGKGTIDYYVTFDRSAFSINVATYMIRKKEGITY